MSIYDEYELTSDPERIDKLSRELASLRTQLKEAQHWQLVADGIHHDMRCCNNAATGGTGDVCLRCRAETAEADNRKLREVFDRAMAWVPAHIQPEYLAALSQTKPAAEEQGNG